MNEVNMRDFEIREVKIVQICDGDTVAPTLALDNFGNIYSFNVRQDVKYSNNKVHTLKMLVKKFK